MAKRANLNDCSFDLGKLEESSRFCRGEVLGPYPRVTGCTTCIVADAVNDKWSPESRRSPTSAL